MPDVEPPRQQVDERPALRGVGSADSYVPTSAIPTEPVLKPPAWAPMTFRSIPPPRPS